jgi:hypothetical protein
MTWTRALALVGAALVAAVLAATATAGAPTRERIEIDETVADEFLTEECGFPVVTTFQGHIIVRTFDRAKGTVSVRTLNILGVATANGNAVRIRDVGADQVRIAPDGTMILSIIGQIPFGPGFTGVLKINLDTGEVIHEPHHFTEDAAGVCAALAA